MMMALDLFVFEMGTAPYTELARSQAWRFADSERLGVRQASQYLGPGDDKITLTGALYPGQLPHTFTSLDTLRALADAGEAYQLIDGQGTIMGSWYITGISDTRSVFFIDGTARKADFSIELKRAEDPQTLAASEATLVHETGH